MIPYRPFLVSLSLGFFLVLSAPAESVVITICVSGCDEVNIGDAEAAAGDNDILRITDSRTYSETWTPGGTRTLESVAGQTPILDGGSSEAVAMDSVGSGKAVTIDGIDSGFLIKSAATEIIGDRNLAYTAVFKNFTIEAGANNMNIFNWFSTSAGTYILQRLIVNGKSRVGANGINVAGNASKIVTVENCLFLNFDGTNGIGITTDSAFIATFTNNHFVNCAKGFESGIG